MVRSTIRVDDRRLTMSISGECQFLWSLSRRQLQTTSVMAVGGSQSSGTVANTSDFLDNSLETMVEFGFRRIKIEFERIITPVSGLDWCFHVPATDLAIGCNFASDPNVSISSRDTGLFLGQNRRRCLCYCGILIAFAGCRFGLLRSLSTSHTDGPLGNTNSGPSNKRQ